MIMLRKFLIASLVGAATFVVTTFAHQVPAWSWLLSVFVSGVALVVQFLADTDARLNTLRREVLDLSAAGELFEVPNSGPLPRDALLHFVRQVVGFDSAMSPLARHLAEVEVGRVSSLLKDLSLGNQLVCDGDDWYWCMTLTAHASAGIEAMTFFSSKDGGSVFDDDLWLSELGKKYLHQQVEAVARGVRVRRIFVLENAGLVNDVQFRQLFDQQRRAGIEVRYVIAADLPGAVDSVVPMVIFDDCVLYEQTPARFHSVPGYVKTTLVLQLPQVQAATRKFQQLWSSGSSDIASVE